MNIIKLTFWYFIYFVLCINALVLHSSAEKANSDTQSSNANCLGATWTSTLYYTVDVLGCQGGAFSGNMTVVSIDKTTFIALPNEFLAAVNMEGCGQLAYEINGNWYIHQSGTNQYGGLNYASQSYPAGSYDQTNKMDIHLQEKKSAAVDPAKIRLFDNLVVWTDAGDDSEYIYGSYVTSNFIAHDTGQAINGKHVDLYWKVDSPAGATAKTGLYNAKESKFASATNKAWIWKK